MYISEPVSQSVDQASSQGKKKLNKPAISQYLQKLWEVDRKSACRYKVKIKLQSVYGSYIERVNMGKGVWDLCVMDA